MRPYAATTSPHGTRRERDPHLRTARLGRARGGRQRGRAAIAHEARERALDIEVVRNGSRGLLWLEPLIELATARGRIGFGPAAADDVRALFERGFPAACAYPLALGPIDEIRYLLTFS